MRAEIQPRQFSERTLRQVRLDCGRAMSRARFCPESSEVSNIQCVDDRDETDRAFGNQLWFFDGVGVDEGRHRQSVYGVVEYSLQFGLQELVEDGVFDSAQERERFRTLYHRELKTSAWRQPAQRWVVAAAIGVAAVALLTLMLRNLLA